MKHLIILLAFLSPFSYAAEGISVFSSSQVIVSQLFQASFGRAVSALDPLNAWVERYDNKVNTQGFTESSAQQDILREMNLSTESTVIYGTKTAEEMVDFMFTNSLGRAANEPGRAAWIARAGRSDIPFAQIQNEILTSARGNADFTYMNGLIEIAQNLLLGNNNLIPDTNQQLCFDASGTEINCSGTGQDGDLIVNAPSYTNHGDGTVTDNISQIMWQQTADRNKDGSIDANDKLSQSGAVTYCQDLVLAGYDDWVLPDIRVMYSLIDFSGEDVSGYDGTDTTGLKPFVDATVFGYGYGDTSSGERLIDAQWATTTIYSSTVMNGEEAMFGVNLADGRIKGYPTSNKTYYVQCVRNQGDYGSNDFQDNGDETITDNATGLMWQQSDNGQPISWEYALQACNTTTTGGNDDWRLPNAKELQYLVDYSRSPDSSASAAINEIFSTTVITNEDGAEDYGFYWSSTTHKNTTGIGSSAVYVSFGRALGYMNNTWLDVHGAGAQRSDPKKIDNVGNNSSYQAISTANGTAIIHGPQGDVVRGMNFVRCVRNQ